MHEVFKTIIKELKKNAESDLRIYGGRCNGKTLLAGYMKGMEDAITIVKKLSGRYNGGWIPCSEKLPEVYEESNTSDIVLVAGYDKEVDFPWQAMGWYAAESKRWFFAECKNTDKEINWIDIVAWQPLPDYYIPRREVICKE